MQKFKVLKDYYQETAALLRSGTKRVMLSEAAGSAKHSLCAGSGK